MDANGYNDARKFRAELANIRQQISAPAEALAGYGRELLEEAQSHRLDQFVPDIKNILRAAGEFQRLLAELLDPMRAPTLMAEGDMEETRRKLRHDLCNPVAAAKGYAELILEDIDAFGAGTLAPDLMRMMSACDALIAEIGTIIGFSENAGLSSEEGNHAADTALRVLMDIRPLSAVERTVAEEGGAILVVDDIETNRDLLARQLSRQGHRPSVASGGAEALKMMEAEAFDLVLLDLMMPGMSGFEVLRRMRARPATLELPVIVISALEEEDSAIRCIEAGAEDYLTKPVNPVLLHARIRAGLDKSRIRHLEAEHRAKLEAEKRKYEALLLNILPKPLVERLAAGEETVADQHDSVTVLFSDFVGFTRLTQRHPSDQIVTTLNSVFSEFDALAQALGIEKIKTIGDGYLAVAGVPEARGDHAEAVAEMALGMLSILDRLNPTLVEPLQMRVGLSSGSVIAGVIGSHKFAYDVWGTTVNMAARHESYSEPNRIHISRETALLLPERYLLESRGILNIRGRGEVETFFLNGLK
jgi:adenylate cyclase